MAEGKVQSSSQQAMPLRVGNVQRVGVYAGVIFFVFAIALILQFVLQGSRGYEFKWMLYSNIGLIAAAAALYIYTHMMKAVESYALMAVFILHAALIVKATGITDFQLQQIQNGAFAVNYAWVFLLVLMFPMLIQAKTVHHVLMAAIPLPAFWLWFVIRELSGYNNLSIEYMTTLSTTALIVAFMAVYISTYMKRLEDKLTQVEDDLKRMGSYVLVKKLGAGGFGEVWLARHALLARPAAIKLIKSLPSNKQERNELIGRFAREAQSTARLSSPHTIQLYDYGSYAEDGFFYVMELLEGMDLHDIVATHGPLPEARVLHILEQICDSLGEAHDNGMIHRDIKPANIFLSKLGGNYDFVKVLDFGLVIDSGFAKDEASRLTEAGYINGTPDFMAPEQATASADLDGRADIYAVGCVAYWLLTGRTLFSGAPMAVLMDQVNKSAPLIEQYAPQLSPETAALVMSCLEKDPNNRPQSMHILAKGIRQMPQYGKWTQDLASAFFKAAHAEKAPDVIPEFNDSLKESAQIRFLS